MLRSDEVYDGDKRLRSKRQSQNCKAVIPSKTSHKVPYPYDKHLYKSLHLYRELSC